MRIASLDDDESQLEQTRFALKAMGHECHTFLTAKQFQKMLLRESFDLLMVDWALPDSTGPDVVRWVREHVQEAVPILFLTSRHDEAALALDGLDDDGRDIGPADLLLHLGRRPRGHLGARVGSVAEGVGHGHAVDLGGEGPEGLLVGHVLGGQCHREVGAAVVAMVEDDDRLPLGVRAGDLDGVLHRLGAGVEECGPLRVVAGGQAIECLAHLDVAGVGRDHEACVREVSDLTLHALDDARATVAVLHAMSVKMPGTKRRSPRAT